MVRCRHPNIVQFLGYVDSPFVIVMEYLPNGDLRQYWRSRKVSMGHKVQICIDVLRALAYLHNRKPSSIIHRDIKPTNVLMTKSGVAKLTDFGLGRLMGQDGSKHLGSHHNENDVYSPPELSLENAARPLNDATAFTGTGKGSHAGTLADINYWPWQSSRASPLLSQLAHWLALTITLTLVAAHTSACTVGDHSTLHGPRV